MGLVVASNREPLRRHGGRWEPAVSGLVSALLPVLLRRGGAWVAWAERRGGPDVLAYPEGDPRFAVHRLALPPRLVEGYYHGMSNRVLWPVALYSIEHLEAQPSFLPAYLRANAAFADAIARASAGARAVWVHDYHLMLVPQLLRRRGVALPVGFFWHVPWPAAEVWRVLPWARELLEGVLAADLVGFHDEEYVRNFLDACRLLVPGADVGRDRVVLGGRAVRVEAHPIGIDVGAFRTLAADPRVRAHAARLRAQAGTDLVLLGVDRLDYSKGIPERLRAFERLLAERPDYRGRATLYQIAVPTRTGVQAYRRLKRTVDELVGRINGAFAAGGWIPVRYLYRAFAPRELTAFYLAADVAVVTPLRDGTNLVAQEYVAVSEGGVLVLSELAGAARVLPEALRVNPFDGESLTRALREALEMPQAERLRRLRALKRRVEALEVHGWAARFLASLEQAARPRDGAARSTRGLRRRPDGWVAARGR